MTYIYILYMYQEIHVVTSVAQIPDAEDLTKLADFFFRRRPATYPP